MTAPDPRPLPETHQFRVMRLGSVEPVAWFSNEGIAQSNPRTKRGAMSNDGSGPLPGGKDITVAQEPGKTRFLRLPITGGEVFRDWTPEELGDEATGTVDDAIPRETLDAIKAHLDQQPDPRDTKIAPTFPELERLRALKPGWDSYGGSPITEAAIKTAEVLLAKTPQAVPCNDGGIQFEWHCGGIDFEFQIGPDGHEIDEDAEIARLQKIVNDVDDVLVVNWVGPREDGDYKKALANLIQQNIIEHDDPSISESAAARISELATLRTRAESAERDLVEALVLCDASQAVIATLDTTNQYEHIRQRPQRAARSAT